MEIPVLIVDDYPEMLRLLRRVLQALGFTRIDQATNGSAALAKLRESAFCLVISDLNMEPMSGLELLREVRSDSKLQSLPFIMLTAANESEKVIAAKEGGVTDYIVKPFTTDTVQRKLAVLFGHPPESCEPVWPDSR